MNGIAMRTIAFTLLFLCPIAACDEGDRAKDFTLDTATQSQLDVLYEVAMAGSETCQAQCEWDRACAESPGSCDSCIVEQGYYQIDDPLFLDDLNSYRSAPEHVQNNSDCICSVYINNTSDVIERQEAITSCYLSATECDAGDEEICLEASNRGGELFGPCYNGWEQAREYCGYLRERLEECGLDATLLWLDREGDCGLRHWLYFFSFFSCYWSETSPERVARWEGLFQVLMESKQECHETTSCAELQEAYADPERFGPICPYSREIQDEYQELAEECPPGTVALEELLENFPNGSLSGFAFYPPVFLKR